MSKLWREDNQTDQTNKNEQIEQNEESKQSKQKNHLCTAAAQGRLHSVENCLQRYNFASAALDDALLFAVENGRAAVSHHLLRSGADPNNCHHPIVVACRKGYIRILEQLLQHGADIHVDGESPLLEAIRNDNTGCVEILLTNGANIHVEDDVPLIDACLKRNASIVSMLAKNGANVDARDGEPLVSSAGRGYNDVVDVLIDAGADVNIENDAPLRHAARGNHILSMISLLNAGADRSILNEFSFLDETTLTILDTFTRSSRLKRLRKAVADSGKKQDFKWQEYCLPIQQPPHNLKLLHDQARLFGIEPDEKSKRRICAELATKVDHDTKTKPVFDEGIVDLSGTPINDLPYWKVMVVENIPFNVFDLFTLIRKGIFTNPYTRNRLPTKDIKEAQDRLRRILTRTRYKDFNLLEQVSQLPILTDATILRNLLQNQVWDRLVYSPPISVIMDANDDEIDDMLRKLRVVCKHRDVFDEGDEDIYPMVTNRICRTIAQRRGLEKKRDFVNLLSTIVNHVDEHRETRTLAVSIVLKHFHRHESPSDEEQDDLEFITEDFDDDEELFDDVLDDWWDEEDED
jgi:ankyrin repeat protein